MTPKAPMALMAALALSAGSVPSSGSYSYGPSAYRNRTKQPVCHAKAQARKAQRQARKAQRNRR